MLMEIAMMCQESSLSDFVGNLTDFTVLLDSMSPAVREFIQNGFKQSVNTAKIKNLDWKIGDQLKVVGSHTMLMS